MGGWVLCQSVCRADGERGAREGMAKSRAAWGTAVLRTMTRSKYQRGSNMRSANCRIPGDGDGSSTYVDTPTETTATPVVTFTSHVNSWRVRSHCDGLTTRTRYRRNSACVVFRSSAVTRPDCSALPASVVRHEPAACQHLSNSCGFGTGFAAACWIKSGRSSSAL